jgi:hypothetical protein
VGENLPQEAEVNRGARHRSHSEHAGRLEVTTGARVVPDDSRTLDLWTAMFDGAPEPTLLPGQSAETCVDDFSGRHLDITPARNRPCPESTLPGIDPVRLRALASARGATLHMALSSCVVRAVALLTGNGTSSSE